MINPYAQYKSVSINTSSTVDQIVIVINAALVVLNKALKCTESNDIGGKYLALQKAYEIFSAMKSGVVDKENKLVTQLVEFFSTTAMVIQKLNAARDSESQEIEKIMEEVRSLRDSLVGLQSPTTAERQSVSVSEDV